VTNAENRDSNAPTSRWCACLVAVFLIGAPVRGGDEKLTKEEQWYVEAAVEAVPIEIKYLTGEIAKETSKERIDSLKQRIRDLETGGAPTRLRELTEHKLKVGFVGHFVGGISPIKVIGPQECEAELMAAPTVTDSGKAIEFKGKPVIVTGIPVTQEDVGRNPAPLFDNFLVVTGKRDYGGNSLFVVKTLDVDVPKLTKIVHQRLSAKAK
jgi:hypothetical protein